MEAQTEFSVTAVVEAQENTESIAKAVNDFTPVIREASLLWVATTTANVKQHLPFKIHIFFRGMG
jgi:hypothetical protein